MDYSREIRQLWFVAESYFKEAERLKIKWHTHLDIKMTDIMDFFENRIPTEDYQKELSLLVAHLNSAAVRLCTINERFHRDLGGKIIKNYITELERKGIPDSRMAEELRRNIEEYLPQILRDGVAHREKGKDQKRKDIWEARHAVIESLKIIEAFTCMQSAIRLFETNLRNKKFIP
jgi:hypothetical protein